MPTVLSILCSVAGVLVLVAAFAGARRRPEWNFRYGPARWLGTLGMLLLLGGLINLAIATS